jgi:hypothetical protein
MAEQSNKYLVNMVLPYIYINTYYVRFYVKEIET